MKTNDARYRSLYNKYILALSPFLYAELKAYSHPTLATVLVMSIIIMGDPYYRLFYTCGASANYYGGLARSLRVIDISATLLEVDRERFNFSEGNGHWAAILPDLFTQTRNQDYLLCGQEYIETARRILTYLCHPRRRPAIYKHPSIRTPKLPGIGARRTGDARKRRANKHQHGLGRHITHAEGYVYLQCERALYVLPEVLDHCPPSPELIGFIHAHVRDIVIIRGATRVALNTISGYLVRSQLKIKEEKRDNIGQWGLGKVCRVEFYRFNVFRILLFCSTVATLLTLLLYMNFY